MGLQPLHDQLVASLSAVLEQLRLLAQQAKCERNRIRRVTTTRCRQSKPFLEDASFRVDACHTLSRSAREHSRLGAMCN